MVSTVREAQNVLTDQRKEKWLLAKLIIRNNFVKEMAFKVSLPRSLGAQPVKLGKKRRSRAEETGWAEVLVSKFRVYLASS